MIEISVLNIVRDTTVDGSGFRTAIYAAGCNHRCKGCHNPQSWDMANGTPYNIKNLLDIILGDEFAHVTFTGGDPLFQVEGFTELAKLIKSETQKNIWCYTGFKFEQIIQSNHLSQILPYIDVLVDGKYVDELRDSDLRFRGSSNQRIINVQDSILQKYIVL